MNDDTETIVHVLATLIVELIEIRKSNGPINALKYFFDNTNNKLTGVEEALVRFLRRLVYNLTMNQKEIFKNNPTVSKVPYNTYSPQSILSEEEDAKEFILLIVPNVLGITVNICKLDIKELSVTFS